MAKKNSETVAATTPAKGNKAQPATTGAKVGKVGGKRAEAAAKPAAKAEAATPAKPRGQFVGKAIRNLVPKGEAHGARGNAGLLYEAVIKHKNADDAIGSTYTRTGGKYDGEETTITSADLAYLVRRELIAVE